MARQKKSKRDDGRLQTSFTFNGKRYFVYGYTQDELEARKAERREQLKAGAIDHDNPRLNDYYRHFTEMRRSRVKESTIRGQSFQFRSCADAVIDDNGLTLGEMRIRDIKPKDVQKVQKVLEASARTSETVNNCMYHLKHVFNAAVKDETVGRNPCMCIEPVQRTEPPARETIHRALTQAETEAFFRTARERNSYYLPLFQVMIQTGMRVGEVGALRDVDVDERNGLLHVRGTITRDEIGAYIRQDATKTAAGKRDIPAGAAVFDAIRRQRELHFALHGSTYRTGTIFTSPENALLRDYSVDREIWRICKKAEIDRFSSHAFRATFATRFVEQRPDDYKALSEILGHTKTQITLDLYTHVMEQTKINAMRNIIIAM